MSHDRPLRIAYLCDISPEHVQPYSGGNARIFRALSNHAEVSILGNGWGAAEAVRRAVYRLPESANLRLRWRLHLAFARVIAAGVRRELERGDYDVLFGAYSFQSMARLRVPPGMLSAFTSDATPTVYKRSEIGASYGGTWLGKRLLDPITLRAERRIFNAVDLLLWPSNWLKSQADALYNLPPGRALVVPWGANIERPVVPAAPLTIPPGGPVNLLLIGRDWFAKGGPLVFEILTTLRARGVDARLTVIGCQPPAFHRNAFVTVLGALEKSDPAQYALFQKTFQSSHFLVQPSIESWGFAFCEAAAYGLPSLCLRAGGVPVLNGQTGHALPLGSGAADFADIVMRYVAAPADYAALQIGARADYETRLNWDTWAQTATGLMARALTLKRGSAA
jgi:glycosyltransferase involved in cell wall biosynthesis